jgi:lipopolysaccharide biosynthesis regulator YciM
MVSEADSETEEVDLSIALDEIPSPAAFVAPSQAASSEGEEQAFVRGSQLLSAGRVNEAIAALEMASRAPRRRFETASLLGRLFRDRGDTAMAVEWLERATDAPSADREAANAVLYDLAGALEDTGETTRALAIYLELQADLGAYRDVETRVERLMRVRAGG